MTAYHDDSENELAATNHTDGLDAAGVEAARDIIATTYIEGQTGEIGPLHAQAILSQLADAGYELSRRASAGETGVREPKYVAIHSSEDPAERLAYELAVELEQADLDRNDFVTVNRAKLLAIASRAVAGITSKPPAGLCYCFSKEKAT